MIPALFARLPRWAWYILGGVAAAIAVLLWLNAHDNAIRADQKAIDQAAFEKALSEAELLAIKAKADAEAHYRELADEADEKARVGIAGARAATADYIERMRVKACPGRPSATPAAAASGGSEGAERPDSDPLLVAVTEEDVHICTTNTVRLQTAQDWAKGL